MNSQPNKAAAALRALDFIKPGMVVGLGTGTTAAQFILALGRQSIPIIGVATSPAAAELALAAGISLADLNDVKTVDLTVDGADQLSVEVDAIKGKGGAFTTERIVWEASKEVLVIVDGGKLVPVIGGVSIPLEINRFGHAATVHHLVRRLEGAGFEGKVELSTGDYSPRQTVTGNPIYLANYRNVKQPAALKHLFDHTHGVIDHGLFCNKASRAIIASDDGIEIIERIMAARPSGNAY